MKKIKFQKIDLISFSKVFLGVALIVLSVVILRSGQGGNIIKTSKVGAVDDTTADYRTVWTADKILTMTVTGNAGDAFLNRKIALGPSGWTVAMSQKNGTVYDNIYEETWSAPITSNMTVAMGATPSIGDINSAKWLFSLNRMNGKATISKVQFQSESASGLNLGAWGKADNSVYKVGNGIHSISGINQSLTVSCTGEIQWCIFPVGGYGWTAFINDDSNRDTIGAEGVMMPLEWTVYGKIL